MLLRIALSKMSKKTLKAVLLFVWLLLFVEARLASAVVNVLEICITTELGTFWVLAIKIRNMEWLSDACAKKTASFRPHAN